VNGPYRCASAFNDFACLLTAVSVLLRRRKFDTAVLYMQAVREVDSDVQPVTFWFSNKERFPHLFDQAIRYLSVPGNLVDAERSVSQSIHSSNAPQRQSFNDANLVLRVMAEFNSTV